MSHSLFVVQTNATPGDDQAFNDWYTHQHIPDVLAISGFVAAQRYQKSATQRGPAARDYPYTYLATYEIAGDIGVALNNLEKAISEGMDISPTLAEVRTSVVYEPLTDRILRSGG